MLKDIGDNAVLMISHFDQDHYNGIIEMPERTIFKKIYLPLYIWHNRRTNYTAKVFIDTIKSLAYLSVMGNSKLSTLQKLFVKLPKLVNRLTDIKCIGANDKIFMGTYRFDILCPEEHPIILFERSNIYYSDQLKNILFETNYQLFEKVHELVVNYVDAFVALYNFYAENKTPDDVENNTLAIIDKRSEDSSKIEQFKELQSNLIVAYDNLNHLKIKPFLNSIKKRVNAISSSLIKGMNACSMVFHNNIYLACGDVTPKVMSYLNNRFYNKYKLLKVAHHGTKSYFSKYMPSANIYLISNSGDGRVDWGIDKRYSKYNICCTNNNRLRCASGCHSPYCNHYSGTPTRKICACNSNCYVIL